ncbi:NAD(P)-dependent dehydrogenase (short-subunit alcohol dehydrogenase family) [Neolewinella xylanilytica]|uniref:NAD(P)-dependent dehydrogenase (Short-subunit alcohol dehydrogenase family) n=1 Tax=Neolewinella xylanilytica TaxID=1514080 RepID=A0A2S6I1F9_9BACT|nr:SDR family oxidoreductase [Neolewinella xylanilytica]PPK84775.1 NAD(P)-dependent dehydrogenase (short-subunit alcohol dehydrogenase family) [Neolewinella xylanilytica]
MKYAFVTGANRSIGLEVTRQLLQRNVYVYLGCRDLDRGQAAVAELKEQGLLQVEAVVVDISNPDSVRAAKETVTNRGTGLDILINNAGISGGMQQGALTMDVAAIREVYDTNLFGTIDMVQNFYPLLRESSQPVIVNVTSGLGSLTLHHDPSWKYYPYKHPAYGPSKTALNAYTTVLAYELRDTAFKVNVVDPGYTATAFNNFSGPNDVSVGAGRIVDFALPGPDGPTGQFISYDNNPETGISPW